MDKKKQLEDLVNIYKNLNTKTPFQYCKIGFGTVFTFGSINADLSLKLLEIYNKAHNYTPNFFERLNHIIYSTYNGIEVGLGAILITSGIYNLAKSLRK